jgi:hypothetical protein
MKVESLMHPNNRSTACLLYCIYHHGEAGPVAGMTGVQDQAVETVCSNDLCAAVSALSDAVPASRVAELKRYGQVVAACHRSHATIPMRYGSIFKDQGEIGCHLEECGNAYQKLLLKLADCEEMGIRLLLPAVRAPWPSGQRFSGMDSDDNAVVQAMALPGKAYLARQKKRYGLTDGFIQRAEAVLFDWRELFKGLFVECRWERPDWKALQKAPILSAYFLVPRRNLVGFQETFVHVRRRRPEKALLSGPWPPYNFVQQERSEANLHDATTTCPAW